MNGVNTCVKAEGVDGDKGDQGEAGRGIEKAEIINGCLWITYTDGVRVNLGRVLAENSKPEDGPNDEMPEKIDMNGYVYKAYVRDFAGTDPDAFQAQAQNGNNDYRCIDFWVDEANSENDAISYSVYQRNQQIESDYNCKIKQISSSGSQFDHLLACASNGDGYDLSIVMAKVAAQAATYNLFRNLNDATYLDLNHTSYDQNSINELSVGNKLYFLSGDMNISTMEVLALSLVNMEFYEDISDSIVDLFSGDPTCRNIYDIVESKKWTMDTMMAIAELANIDTDISDGSLSVLDKGDAIGYYQYLYSPIWYYYGSGARLTAKNYMGAPEFTFDGDTEEYIYNYLFDHFNRNNSVPWLPQSGSGALNNNFLTGDVLFTDSTLFNVRTEIYPNAEFEYGILPIPVLEEGMNYQSVVYFNNWAHLWAIPTVTNNTEYAERMMQVMATYSSLPNSTMYAYYDMTVCLQAAPDNGSREVMDTIKSSTVYDMALLYCWGGMDNWINQVATGYTNDYAMFSDMLYYLEEDMYYTIQELLNPSISW